MTPRMRIFRWRAVGPLLLFAAALVVLWVGFGDWWLRRQAESGLTELLGTQVDIGWLRLREGDAALDLRRLAIAHPRDPRRNLFEADTIEIDLDPAALAEKKIVIDRLRLNGLRVLTPRRRPARPASPNSPAGRLLGESERWAREKFQIPSLAMGRVDSARALVLHPDQLGTARAAAALAGTADSSREALASAVDGLALKALVDSSGALATRMSRTDPKKLGAAGARQAASDIQQALDRIKAAKGRTQALAQSARASYATMERGLAGLNEAREKDYALARGLLDLPSLQGPNIGTALFGSQSTDYFAQALYYARLADRYLPPGLQPWNRPGPKRTRLSGTTVEFPKERELPRFLLREGNLSLTPGPGGRGSLVAAVAGLTSQPALYGKPMTMAARGRLPGEVPRDLDLTVFSRHFGKTPRDSLAARLTGVEIPAIRIPSLPFTVQPGRGTVSLAFRLEGDRLAGRWEIASDQAAWSADSGRLATASPAERMVWQVVSGLRELQVRAELGGTVTSPRLTVRSNLDDAIAGRLRALAGEALARAEARARAAVDSLVGDATATALRQVNGFQAEAFQRLPAEQGKLDEVQKRLETELRRMAGAAAGGLRLPKL